MALGRLSSPCYQSRRVGSSETRQSVVKRLSLRTKATERPRSAEPFNEGMASVRRLVDRDKKEFLNSAGNSGDIMEKFITEFGDQQEGVEAQAIQPLPGTPNPFEVSNRAAVTTPSSNSASASSSSSSSATAPRSSNAVPEINAASPNPFKSSAPSPFGSSTPKPFRSAIEPAGLSPDMGPDYYDKDKEGFSIMSLFNSTSLILIFSFSTIIGLMLATVWVVYNAGGISIAGID